MRCDYSCSSSGWSFAVSIHTPTWGVTLSLLLVLTLLFVFQSTHLHEVWHRSNFTHLDHSSFNPHTYMRCDQDEAPDVRETLGFNPHTYMRCDDLQGTYQANYKVSIHTPTWGVTSAGSSTGGRWSVSIHTPTWGVTLCWITYYQPASLINYYANRYYFFDFTTQNCSINKLIYWFLTPAKLLFFL